MVAGRLLNMQSCQTDGPDQGVVYTQLWNCLSTMGFDFHLIANFTALALITVAGPAVIFILFYRRGAL